MYSFKYLFIKLKLDCLDLWCEDEITQVISQRLKVFRCARKSILLQVIKTSAVTDAQLVNKVMVREDTTRVLCVMVAFVTTKGIKVHSTLTKASYDTF